MLWVFSVRALGVEGLGLSLRKIRTRNSKVCMHRSPRLLRDFGVLCLGFGIQRTDPRLPQMRQPRRLE